MTSPFQTKAYCVYILQSELDDSFYIGYTSNLEQRVWEHNHGRTGYSSRKRPWTLRHVEWFDSKTDAIRRERFINAQKSREWITKLIKDSEQRYCAALSSRDSGRVRVPSGPQERATRVALLHFWTNFDPVTSPFQTKAYCVYILQSELDDSFYIGYTSNLEQRVWEHNQGRTGYSSRKRPWTLRHVEWFDSKTEAIRRERFIKAQKSREWITKLIEDSDQR